MSVIIDPSQRRQTAGEGRQHLAKLDRIGNLILIEDPTPHRICRAILVPVGPVGLLAFCAADKLHSDAGRPPPRPPLVYLGQRPYESINAIANGSVDGFNFNSRLAEFREFDVIAHAANLPAGTAPHVDLGNLRPHGRDSYPSHRLHRTDTQT